jgi:hypothetical protein
MILSSLFSFRFQVISFMEAQKVRSDVLSEPRPKNKTKHKKYRISSSPPPATTGVVSNV